MCKGWGGGRGRRGLGRLGVISKERKGCSFLIESDFGYMESEMVFFDWLGWGKCSSEGNFSISLRFMRS